MKKLPFLRRRRLFGVVCAACLATAAISPGAWQATSLNVSKARPVAFHSHFGGSRFGGGLFSRRRGFGRNYGYGYRGRYRSRPSLFHRIARALAFAYILHLLFTNGVFSFVVWLLIIAVVFHLFRRRPRRFSY